jgi:hypothetical protein
MSIVIPLFEISEKVQKFLIPPIRDRLHRYETYWKIMEICVIESVCSSFSELSFLILDRLPFQFYVSSYLPQLTISLPQKSLPR